MSTSSIFTGASRYATDFQSVIDRSVAIASLPLSQLQTQKATLSSESSALSSVDSKVAALQAAIKNVGTAMSSGTYRPSVSDSDVLSSTLTSGSMAGTYRIHVTNMGSQSSGMSKDGLTAVADPAKSGISQYDSYTLTVSGTSYSINPASNTLSELAKAINDSGAGVLATIINTGTSAAPNYQLAIESNKLGADTIQLTEGSAMMDDTGVSAGTLTKVTDAATENISDATTFTLRVDGTDYAISPAGKNLNALADAINQEAAAGVQAAVIDVGTGGDHDYRLQLTPTAGSNVQLLDGAGLFDQLTTGSDANYTVNGKPDGGINSNSRSVTIAVGLDATLLGTGDSTITVSQVTSGITNAMSGVANAYNALITEMDKYRGADGGALAGNPILNTIRETLNQLTSYGSGSAASDRSPNWAWASTRTRHSPWTRPSSMRP